MSKSYSDAVQSCSVRGKTQKRGSELSETVNSGLTTGGDEVIGGDNVKSLLLSNSSNGDDKNLCFVNSAVNLLRCTPGFR